MVVVNGRISADCLESGVSAALLTSTGFFIVFPAKLYILRDKHGRHEGVV